MNARRRTRLVKEGGVEAFELRATLWFDEEGKSFVTLDITDPDGPTDPGMHEILGVLALAADMAKEQYA